MSWKQTISKASWRTILSVGLLAWILHSIFLIEARRAAADDGLVWQNLSRAFQWRLAWTRGPGELWQTIHLVDPLAFGVSLLFMGMTIFLGLIRWRMVLRVQGLELPLLRIAEISLVAHFFNSFLLGSTGGDLLKAYYAARETHHKKTEAVLTVLVDRLVGLFSMLLFASLMMLPNLDLLERHRRLAALAGIVLMMMAGCGVIAGLSFWGGVSKTWPRARQLLKTLPKGHLVERALAACREFGRQPGFLLQSLGISMVLNVFCVLQIIVLNHGLHLEVPVVALFVIVPIVVCISALPITPSGLGLRENLYVLMLAVPEINAAPTRALSLSLLAYAGSLIWSLIGGFVYLTRRDRDRLAEITAPDNTQEQVRDA